MDYQALVNCCSVASAILSVEMTPEGRCGDIRIVCANQPYRESMGSAYHDGMLYQELVPQDPKFEDFCFRAAHKNQRMHAYVEAKAFDGWADQVMIPLQPQGPGIGYCQFLIEFTKAADPTRMASVSMNTASAIIKASITLLNGDDFKESVRDVLTDLLEISGAFACRITLVDHDKREAINFCEKVKGFDTPPTARGDGVIPYEVVATWEPMIGVSNAVIAKDERDMDALEQRNPEWVRSMRQYGVENIVLIPLRRGKEVFGFLSIVNFDAEKVVEVKEFVELMTVLLGPEISNYLLMRRLEEMSTADALTGMLNRRAMDNRMAAMSACEDPMTFGIVSIDVNGLKAENDSAGHDAGDQLILKAANALSGVFRKDDLFRSGGDEFVVIADGMVSDAFQERVDRIRARAAELSGVSLAIGSYWSDGSVDVHEAFRLADEDMYADKQSYYDSHPEARR